LFVLGLWGHVSSARRRLRPRAIAAADEIQAAAPANNSVALSLASACLNSGKLGVAFWGWRMAVCIAYIFRLLKDGRLCAAAFVQNRKSYTGCTDAPNPAGESGRSWCYVEAQVSVSVPPRCFRASMLFLGRVVER
jgi:hypothetical protein